MLHHTQCGIARLVNQPDLLADYFGIDEAHLADKAVNDPYRAVAVDAAVLKANPALPATWIVSGMVYDVASGVVEVVVPQSTLR